MNNDNIVKKEENVPKLERPASLALVEDPLSCMKILEEDCILELYEENLRLKRECIEAQFLIKSLTSHLVAAVESDVMQHQRCEELTYEKNLHCVEAVALKNMFLNTIKSSNDSIHLFILNLELYS